MIGNREKEAWELFGIVLQDPKFGIVWQQSLDF